jgi:hypothetical protein
VLFVGDLFLIVVCVFGSFALRLPLGPLFVFTCRRLIGWWGSLCDQAAVYFSFACIAVFGPMPAHEN